MTQHSLSNLFTPLSQIELDELDQFLLSDATSDEVMQLDALDGYLTAIVCGPVALKPHLWLPRVWGPSVRDEPVFETMAQAQRIFDLIVRHMNGIISGMQADPDAHEPIFDRVGFEDDPREYLDGEMWAYGFMVGIGLSQQSWQPFLEAADGADMLRPVYLLGADDVSIEEEALVETPEQREELTQRIPASVAAIYRFWQPFRPAVVEPALDATKQRDSLKIGRNDPCSCGSGKKFKKCCAAAVLH
ncbi:MAG TPA: UPF0149 family protein [Gallionella sp.]|nr:UPF0149 family protein [Gallionella sp.]